VGVRVAYNGNVILNSNFNGNSSYGILVDGTSPITGLQMDNVVTASNGISNVYATGNVAAWQVKWSGGTNSGTGPNWDLSAASVGNFYWESPYLEFNGPAIKFGPTSDISISGGVIATGDATAGILFSGTTAFVLTMTGVQMDVGSLTTPLAAIDLSTPNGAWVVLTNNTFKGWQNGIAFGSSPGNGVVAVGNYFDTRSAPITGTFSSATRASKIQPNFWGNTYGEPATYASATSITLNPWEDVVYITGTTAINAILSVWPGRSVTLIFQNATPGGVTTGGNILRAQSAANNQSIRLVCDGTNWF
jgi:hypothetical protein